LTSPFLYWFTELLVIHCRVFLGTDKVTSSTISRTEIFQSCQTYKSLYTFIIIDIPALSLVNLSTILLGFQTGTL